jgi:serine/threonine protein kinase
MSDSKKPSVPCPNCGSVITGDAPFGLCAACLVSSALDVGKDDELLDPDLTVEEWHSSDVALPFARVGPYRLLSKIGEGAFGDVFSAVQDKPVSRQVAVKLLKRGLESAQVVARFEAEQQALALMHHPNVATVLDGGESKDGRPYFVMELVEGRPINQYCKERMLDLRTRLEIFIAVCEGVQHAHGRGIIHRDLKPQNILVEERDGTGVPKVIDFGIAKATECLLTTRTLHTEIGRRVGTPAYMSPEQAESGGADVDVRSDVYSLGVVLYELLTGEPPFADQRLRRVGAAEMERILKEEEPARPSVLVMGQPSSPLASEPPPRLAKRIRGDLDWIVMKALAKERDRRYASAADFARDVRQYLDGGAVMARPPSAAYRMRKWARRHKAPLAAAAAAFVALATGTVIATLQAIRAVRAERAAEERAEIASAVNGFLEYDLLAAALEEGSLNLAMMPLILAHAEERIDGRLTRYPVAEASARLLLGRAFLGAYQVDAAVRNARRAFELYEEHLPDPRDFRYLGSAQTLARALIRQRNPDESVVVVDAVMERLNGLLDMTDKYVSDLLQTKIVALQQAGVGPAALLPTQVRLLAVRYTDYDAWHAIYASYQRCSSEALKAGDVDAAAKYLRNASIVGRLLTWSGTWIYRLNATAPLRAKVIKAGARYEQTATPWKTRLAEWNRDEIVAELALPEPASTMVFAFLQSEAGDPGNAAGTWAEVTKGKLLPESHRILHARTLCLEASGDLAAAERLARQALELAHSAGAELEIQFYAATWARLRRAAEVALDATTLPVSTPVTYAGNGHRYALVEIPLPWQDARAVCRELGGHLATVSDGNENQFLFESFAAARMCWLGASDHEIEGEWKWENGEPWVYSHWNERQPSGTKDGNEDEDYAIFGLFEHQEEGVRWTWTSRDQWLDHPGNGIVVEAVEDNPHANLLIGFAICEWESP